MINAPQTKNTDQSAVETVSPLVAVTADTAIRAVSAVSLANANNKGISGPGSFEQADLSRRRKILNIFFLIILITTLLSSITALISIIFVTKEPFTLFTFLPTSILFIWGYWLNKNASHYRAASWILLVGILVSLIAAYTAVGTHTPLLVLFTLPIILAVVLLSTWEVVFVAAICIGDTTMLILAQDVFRFYQPIANAGEPAISGLTMVVIFFPALTALVLFPFRSQLQLLKSKNTQLEQALVALAAKQRTNQETSYEVLAIAVQLRETATHQSEESLEQLSNLTQVNASLQELATNADQIAIFTVQVGEVTARMSASSQQIVQTTNQANQESERGQAAVERTNQASQEVAKLYEQLLSVHQELNNRSVTLLHLLELVKWVSEETHLLSLNAAIEAAGAGEQGERFAVVAAEIKNLANRSSQSNKEVVEIVAEIQQTTTTALKTAQAGYELAVKMGQEVIAASEVIETMRQKTEQAQQEASSINQKATEISTLTMTVQSNTSQQRVASQQVLAALIQLRGLAGAGADHSVELTATTVQLEVMSNQLNAALVEIV